MTAHPPLTLYFAPGASSMAPHIALNEVGAPFTARPISWRRGDHRAAAFLALNPAGQVPVLLVGDHPLTEVAGCLTYIARAYPQARLLPGDPEGEAQAVSWMSFCASTLHPARRQGMEAAGRAWSLAEARLAGRPWAHDSYSIADIHLFRLFWRASASLHLPREGFPGLFAHHDRMMARPAIQATLAAEAAIGYELPA